MSETFSIAETAIRNSMATLDRVSNNVANASTPGYKRELSVQGAFDTQLRAEEVAQRTITRDWSSGSIKYTGAALDFAIEGDGWFQLQSPQGLVVTRDGSFRMDAEGRLVSSHGWPVVLEGAAAVSGTLSLRAGNELWADGVRVGRFALVAPQGQSLEAAGPGVYRANGAESLDANDQTSVRQGYVETSNVNSLNEMVDLIQAVRQAEAAQRLMRAYDDAIGTALATLGEF